MTFSVCASVMSIFDYYKVLYCHFYYVLLLLK